MNKIERYTPVGNGVAKTKENGEFVHYDDYALLKHERIHDLNQIGGLQEENARLKAEVERLTDFTTRTIIPNGILQTEVNQLKIELADAQESYHIINEIIASERNVHRTNTMMLKDQMDGLQLDNRLLGERVLAYQRLKQLNDISRPPNEV